METDALVRALKSVPEVHLRLVDLAWKVVGEDGTVDVDKLSFYAEELREAAAEAEAYSKATQELTACLRELARSEP